MEHHKYKNPPNADSIMESIRNNRSNAEKIIEIIATVYPSWIQCSIPKFSDDYGHFQKNWETVCSKLKTTPVMIILIDFFSFEPEFTLIQFFCDILTSYGFLMRPKDDFTQCEICGNALATEKIYNIIDKKFRPEKFSDKCVSCQTINLNKF